LQTQQLQLELQLEEEKTLRKQAQSKAEAERNVISFICHEVRNPFAVGVLCAVIRWMIPTRADVEAANLALAHSLGPLSISIVQAVMGFAERIDSVSSADLGENTPGTIQDINRWAGYIIDASKHITNILDNTLGKEDGCSYLFSSHLTRGASLADPLASSVSLGQI
jgi:hypothetical protein